ncbi:MAG TPA: hypothetical protein VMM93_13555 [Vicinamibacterales bacterium]|nr:hypothetical protein [Vicinamibacterales bacterium]
MAAGETDARRLADLAQRALRRKRPALEAALSSEWTGHQRFLLTRLLAQVDFLDAEIAVIPGVHRKTAESLVAELGVNMAIFPDAAHLASSAGWG